MSRRSRPKARRFGTLWLDSGTADAKNAAAAFDKRLRDAGVDLAASVPYTLDPARLQEQADSAVAKLKSAGVTSVIFSGDPVAPTRPPGPTSRPKPFATACSTSSRSRRR